MADYLSHNHIQFHALFLYNFIMHYHIRKIFYNNLCFSFQNFLSDSIFTLIFRNKSFLDQILYGLLETETNFSIIKIYYY